MIKNVNKESRRITEEIFYGKNSNKIVVFDNEAGAGKTTSFINSMIELYKLNPSAKILIVQKFRDAVVFFFSSRFT